jgi:FKBP-type peptidyl-prolyl cis-trans isomerase FklB
MPADTSRVKVEYEGRLIDGTVFDSSYQRGEPAEFAVGQVIAGWTEALKLMPVGSEWEIYIPQELAYGSQQAGPVIKPFSALVFKVKLLEIVQ